MFGKAINRLLFAGPGGATVVADLGLTILRVASGAFLAIGHGWPKLFKSEGFIEQVAAQGFPAPALMGWGAILGEFIGGILLALGLATRPAALWLAGVFAGAAFMTHAASFTGDAPFFMPAKGAVEGALLYLAIAVMFVFTGSGRFGVDRFLHKS